MRNTVVRATGEIVGKLASLALFAALARIAGASELGVFVLAFAYMQIALTPVELGFERYLLRQVASDRGNIDRLLVDILVLRFALAVPVVALAMAGTWALGYDAVTRETVAVLAAGLVIDLLTRMVFSVFAGIERFAPVAATVVLQRVGGAILGLGALSLGYGVVAVAMAYTAGAAIGLAVVAVLLVRAVGAPERRVRPRGWKRLAVASSPFAIQDVFTVLLFKLDAVLLSLLATGAAVGRYGAAYRLFESTFFITYSLAGAFSAMFTYLGPDTDPSLATMFRRSIKLALVALIPCAVVFAVLAEPLSRLFFGDELAGAAAPLRLLAPAAVLLGVVTLSSSLLVSRGRPRSAIVLTAAMVVLNVALNLVLIPRFMEEGAAAAMLVTEAVFAVGALGLAARRAGRLRWAALLAAPVAGGAGMAVVVGAFRDELVPAAAAGIVGYVLMYAAVERLVDPAELRSLVAGAGRRFGGRAA